MVCRGDTAPSPILRIFLQLIHSLALSFIQYCNITFNIIMFIEHLLCAQHSVGSGGERDQSVVGSDGKTRAQHCADYRPSGCTKEGSSLDSGH